MFGGFNVFLYLCRKIRRYGIRGIAVQNGAFAPLGVSGEQSCDTSKSIPYNGGFGEK
jgi:hypothetical protein